jgi:D-arabinose 1-dehydrogenase-like Zn-dependent alcohol dehydrogenase
MSLPKTMKAVVLVSPLKVAVVDRPTPTILEQDDAIIKVHLAGLCGTPRYNLPTQVLKQLDRV